MKEEPLQQEKENKEIKSKKWIWIIIIISTIIIIGEIILIIFLVKNKKDKDLKEEKEINTEPESSEPSLAQEEFEDYDKLCLLLQLGSFAGKEANSFSPRAEPKQELREDGVYVRTEINFGEQFPNSYLDIYYPGPIEEDRPTYIYWHGGGHIFGDKNLGDPISPNSDTVMHMLDYICKKGFNLISVNYCFASKYRYPA